jgi:uracil-DNA glycosylase
MGARITATAGTVPALEDHVRRLLQCRRCPRMLPPPVSGGPVPSRIILVGQAPGVREPVLGRPFAWTAGKTLFRWLNEYCALDENEVRSQIYFAAVCRCFPGKASGGTDRVPSPEEVRNCSSWMNDEFDILKPRLVLPVGKLAISQFLPFEKLDQVIGRKFTLRRARLQFDVIPLPHPSGASPWHKIPPGRELTARALRRVARHPEMRALRDGRTRSAALT